MQSPSEYVFKETQEGTSVTGRPKLGIDHVDQDVKIFGERNWKYVAMNRRAGQASSVVGYSTNNHDLTEVKSNTK
jgi:translation elongation factor EF-Tu-like GTPase